MFQSQHQNDSWQPKGSWTKAKGGFKNQQSKAIDFKFKGKRNCLKLLPSPCMTRWTKWRVLEEANCKHSHCSSAGKAVTPLQWQGSTGKWLTNLNPTLTSLTCNVRLSKYSFFSQNYQSFSNSQFFLKIQSAQISLEILFVLTQHQKLSLDLQSRPEVRELCWFPICPQWIHSACWWGGRRPANPNNVVTSKLWRKTFKMRQDERSDSIITRCSANGSVRGPFVSSGSKPDRAHIALPGSM